MPPHIKLGNIAVNGHPPAQGLTGTLNAFWDSLNNICRPRFGRTASGPALLLLRDSASVSENEICIFGVMAW